MRIDRLPFLAVAVAIAVLGSCLPEVASAQFFVLVEPTSLDPFVCTSAGLTITGTANSSYQLPAPPDNEFVTLAVNGSVLIQQTSSVSPASGSFSGPLNIAILLPTSTPLPYVAVATLSPALGGTPVGRGTRITVTCTASGPGTATFEPFTNRTSAVPAIPPAGLALLSLLLALATARRLRRRGA